MCNQSERAACSPPLNPLGYVTASKRRVNRSLAPSTLAFDTPRHKQYPIPRSAPAVSPRALNCAQPAADTLIIALPQPIRTKLQLITSAHAHTPVVLPMWQHLQSPLVAQQCVIASNAPCDVRSNTLHNLSAIYINCSSPVCQPTRSSPTLFFHLPRRTLFPRQMETEAEERIFTDVLLQKTKAANLPKRLRACSLYEVTVENINRALLAIIARDGQITLRDALHACITALRSPLADFYHSALIAADINAHEMSVRSLAGTTTTVLAYRFKAYTVRVARDLGEMVIARHDERAFANKTPLSTLESTTRASLCVRYASRLRSCAPRPLCRTFTPHFRLPFSRPTCRLHLLAGRTFRPRRKQVALCRPRPRRLFACCSYPALPT